MDYRVEADVIEVKAGGIRSLEVNINIPWDLGPLYATCVSIESHIIGLMWT
jgi:hypothetical protein